MKNFISYLIACALAVLYMVYLDEESGLIIVALMLFAPIFSFLFAFITSQTTSVLLEFSSDIINCGEQVEIMLHTTRKICLPSAPIIADIVCDGNFEKPENSTIKIILPFKKSDKTTFKLKSKYATAGRISIENARATDFLGMFSLKVNLQEKPTLIAVVPKIAQSGRDNAVFDSFSANLNYDDEQETTNTAISMHATPGYEHREYVPSDPLKRINWKLSSKLNKLMVRLDEALSASNPIFVIDITAKNDVEEIEQTKISDYKEFLSQELYQRAQDLLENVLGTLRYFTMQGIECKVFYTSSNEAFLCTNSDDINKLAIEISKQSIFDKNAKNVLDNALTSLNNECNIVYCTFAKSFDAAALAMACKDHQANAAIITAPNVLINASGIPTYTYDENNSLKLY